jgi:Haem-binding domain/Cytochrome P460
MKTFVKSIGVLAIVVLVLQLARPGITDKPAAAELQVPHNVREILDRSCYSCHSDQRRLSWFDQVVPAYWLVRHDVLKARRHLDFSTLGAQPETAQKAALYEAVNMIRLGAMPLPQFTLVHQDAKVSGEEIQMLEAYLALWSAAPRSAEADIGTGGAMGGSLTNVKPEFNGVPIDPDFENWKPISTTDRGDNNSLRLILANNIAFEAAHSGNISPWPSGSRLAKIAWQQVLGPDGLIHPGRFIQVELMLKDARDDKKTEGWGWGRWRGLDLKPYGHDGDFVNECTGCHMPVRGNDYVYTLPITPAQPAGVEVVNHRAAALPLDLPYQPLGWRAITIYVDPNRRTTAMLFGNDAAMKAVHVTTGGDKSPAYFHGAVLALVTWAQRDDPHWFGARIPDAPLSVEFVEIGGPSSYRRFAGPALAAEGVAAQEAAQRESFIVSLSPAQLP